MASLGVWVVYAGFTYQNLNTNISTESELIGDNDFMPQVVWNRYFLQYQGYDVRKNVMYQDNQSSIMFKNNGKGSSSNRIRPINICYFFFTDRTASVHLDMDHFPTEYIIADFFTKPLQGYLFWEFCIDILYIKDWFMCQGRWDYRSVLWKLEWCTCICASTNKHMQWNWGIGFKDDRKHVLWGDLLHTHGQSQRYMLGNIWRMTQSEVEWKIWGREKEREGWMFEKASPLVFYNLFDNYRSIFVLPQHMVSLHWCAMLGQGWVVSTGTIHKVWCLNLDKPVVSRLKKACIVLSNS